MRSKSARPTNRLTWTESPTPRRRPRPGGAYQGAEIERYTPERKAEFILSNAIDAEDYAAAVREVRSMGLDPARIPHYKPPGA